MVLVSWLIFNKLFCPEQLKKFSNQLKKENMNRKEYQHSVTLNTLWFCVLCLFLLFNIAPAILIASNCHNNSPLQMIVAFLFSDIYVFHYTIQKFIFNIKKC